MINKNTSFLDIRVPYFSYNEFYNFTSNINSRNFVKTFFDCNTKQLPLNVFSIHDKSSLSVKRKFKKIVSLFREETNNDGPYYSEYGNPNLGFCGNYVIVEEFNNAVAIIGGFSFTRKNIINYNTNEIISFYYELSWIWIHPYRRNNKLFSKLWDELKNYYGDFTVQKPYSEQMKKFLLSKGYSYSDVAS